MDLFVPIINGLDRQALATTDGPTFHAGGPAGHLPPHAGAARERGHAKEDPTESASSLN